MLARLRGAWPGLDLRIELFTTSGDKLLDKPLPEIGGKGLFTEELENALRAGEIGILFLGMLHSIEPYLAKNIKVRFPLRQPHDSMGHTS